MPLAPFITAQEFVDHLGRGTITDPDITFAIDAACDECRRIAEQDFTAGTATISLDGNDGDALILPKFPVTAAGTVLINGGTITDYVLTGNGLLLRGTAGVDPRPTWPGGRQNITVTFEHGYQAIDIPGEVRMVALSIASRYVVQGVAKSETQGDLSITYAAGAGDVTSNEDRILKKCRRTRSF